MKKTTVLLSILCLLMLTAICDESRASSIGNGTMTADDFASAAGHGFMEPVQRYLEQGGDVNAKTSNGSTALALACSSYNLEIIKLLIEKGANVNEEILDYTPLHRAVSNGTRAPANNETVVVELLLANGADINAKNRLGETPLSIALHNKYTVIANYLKQQGAK